MREEEDDFEFDFDFDLDFGPAPGGEFGPVDDFGPAPGGDFGPGEGRVHQRARQHLYRLDVEHDAAVLAARQPADVLARGACGVVLRE